MAKLASIADQNKTSNRKNEDMLREAIGLISKSVDTRSEGKNFKTFEAMLLETLNDVGQAVLQQKLQSIAAQFETEYLLVDDVRYKRHSIGKVKVHSLCGSFDLERYIYRRADVRNGPTVVPVELHGQIHERTTPALAYRIALGDAQCPGRQWEDQMRADHCRPPSRSTLERIAKKLGTTARNIAAEILPEIRKNELPEREAVSVSIGLDRTTIPMEEPLKSLCSIEPLKKRKKFYVRKKPAPVTVNYRMAYVGTVSLNGGDGQALRTYRYACSADEEPSQVLDNIMDDLRKIQQHRRRSKLPELPMGIIQDGAPEMWNLIQPALKNAFPQKSVAKAIDRYHLAERLAESLKALNDQCVNRYVRMREWSHSLKHSIHPLKPLHDKILC